MTETTGTTPTQSLTTPTPGPTAEFVRLNLSSARQEFALWKSEANAAMDMINNGPTPLALDAALNRLHAATGHMTRHAAEIRTYEGITEALTR